MDRFRCHKCFQVMPNLSSFMRVGCDGLVLLQTVRKCYEKNVENGEYLGEYLQALLLFHFSKNNILGTVICICCNPPPFKYIFRPLLLYKDSESVGIVFNINL